ncbi:DUF3152 domain-containing protein [Demequina sp. NBRC 110057]|uniref:DUF3152 domain-containing protein n=1 Tax=Demequina sp. NBRC 110057 TaxID=1570346 RepID=UPI00135638DD|nr:DUF3152 domain-containing protein [Demequina sp. NBRC 110057]
MTDDKKRLFAGRGITPKGGLVVAGIVVGAFALGIGVGWGTSLVGGELAAPAPSVTASPTASETATPEVSLDPMEPIDRELDEADAAAGLVSLEVPTQADGTFHTVNGDAQPTGDAKSVKWVRVETEDGLTLDGDALATFVIDTLNDPRGWGAKGLYEFVPTTGAPDVRIVVASPTTAAVRCPTPHVAARIGAVTDATASASPSPTPEASAATSCADEGLVVVSLYDWAAGLDGYGDDRTGAREYLVNHGLGHVLGEEDVTCTSGRAPVMADQADLDDACDPNPWPSPDEPVGTDEPSADASATAKDE